MAQASPPATVVDKPIHTIILDSSPLLLNTPGISTLLAHGHDLVTTPTVIAEIRGEEARSRIDTLYKPFLTIRAPRSESIKLIKDFARKTGDGAVLSATDFEILALAYDIECERNGGHWRLRSTPGQKRLNGSPPSQNTGTTYKGTTDEPVDRPLSTGAEDVNDIEEKIADVGLQDDTELIEPGFVETMDRGSQEASSQPLPSDEVPQDLPVGPSASREESDSDSGWITPANIKKKKAKDDSASSKSTNEIKQLQVATMTGDFAMQNVLLQMNLNLLSAKTCQRISQIKQFVLRCHGCFSTTKDMTKQFCPRCGQPTLTRVSCSTNDKGEVKLHLKANMQWNNKGNVFSVPKATSGTSNQKWKGPRQGGGQGGWGNDLILAEDQKEYIRALSAMKRSKERDPMDEDTLPSILSGHRDHGSGKVRVGAGRTVNSRKR
ncbi:uncharacterized protein A1O9_12215 [Exophiala aquamarina CBS 119918]|uniref:20S-pre-rRNA D-site endonuclease NOB1 n=1 Tax=Exophiala aquamarina CBS 119918 TaxID=1182545 RepID=A0A072NWS2_9EURO|nr:uncharacterized protein A1O9_12215 [Exophiala aquamarina CBS 119918]KEF51877.1 hypothetical protein A1O9_12215 [Exophiala aquamarina CBS 119918]